MTFCKLSVPLPNKYWNEQYTLKMLLITTLQIAPPPQQAIVYAIGCMASFAFAILIESIVIPRVLLISKKKRLYDIPDNRKSHKSPIPRLAGITFLPVLMLSFLPVLGGQAAFMPDPSAIYSPTFIASLAFMMCGCMALVLLGIKDDLIGVRYSHKFIIQIIAALLLIASGTYINNLQGLLGIYAIPYYIGIPLTLLLAVYIINSINLIDGVDGLAATLISIATLCLGGCLFAQGSYSYASLAFAITGMLIPFIHYNTASRRKIFMGDTGSLTLGYMVAFLAIHFSMQRTPTSDSTPLAQPIIIAWSVLFVPLFDTARVICVRASLRKGLFSPDRNHIHHKLLDLGYSHKKVTLTLSLFALTIIGANLMLMQSISINLILAINLAAGILFNVYFNKRRKTKIQHPPKEITLAHYTIQSNYCFRPLPARQTVVNTLNPHSWVTAEQDPEFKQALLQSDSLIPDGTGIILAVQWLTGWNIHKTAGADLHLMVLEQLNRTAGSVFYLGASPRTLTQIAQRIHDEYPRIRVSTFSPPYRTSFSAQETERMIAAVNTSHPDVLFVGMTAPKQEKWIAANRHRLNARFISGIGAVFGFYAGTTARPPQWMIGCGLEWLGRLLKEPRRMWKRNFVSTPKFIWALTRLKYGEKAPQKVHSQNPI